MTHDSRGESGRGHPAQNRRCPCALVSLSRHGPLTIPVCPDTQVGCTTAHSPPVSFPSAERALLTLAFVLVLSGLWLWEEWKQASYCPGKRCARHSGVAPECHGRLCGGQPVSRSNRALRLLLCWAVHPVLKSGSHMHWALYPWLLSSLDENGHCHHMVFPQVEFDPFLIMFNVLFVLIWFFTVPLAEWTQAKWDCMVRTHHLLFALHLSFLRSRCSSSHATHASSCRVTVPSLGFLRNWACTRCPAPGVHHAQDIFWGSSG